MGNRLVIVVLFLLSVSLFSNKVYSIKQAASNFEMSVATSEESMYQTTKALHKKLLKEVMKSEIIGKVKRIPISDVRLLIDGTTYTFDKHGFFYDQMKMTVHKPDDKTRRKLLDVYDTLRQEHYGELISWNEVERSIPKYTQFEIVDLDTGISFHVERRAGSGHADVQPLTFADTKKMKQIYREWSWKRRGIVIKVDNKLIAASMNGMPHGKGAIRNGFPGHFCIHFKDSIVHKTRKVDLAHQMMVYKGAGKLTELQGGLRATEVVELFVEALDHKEMYVLEQLTSGRMVEFIDDYLDQYDGIRFAHAVEKDFEPSLLVSRVLATVSSLDNGRLEKQRPFTFYLKRVSPTDGWIIDTVVGE